MSLSKLFKFFGWGSYYGSIDERGLLLSDIFGKKIIPWKDIISASTSFINEDYWGYLINTPNDYYIVRPKGKSFEDLLVVKASLEPYGVHKFDPINIKRWKKIGQPYKKSKNFITLTEDFNYTNSEVEGSDSK